MAGGRGGNIFFVDPSQPKINCTSLLFIKLKENSIIFYKTGIYTVLLKCEGPFLSLILIYLKHSSLFRILNTVFRLKLFSSLYP